MIASLNYLGLELLNAGHYLTVSQNRTVTSLENLGHWLIVGDFQALPAVTLYEYYARCLARDLTHTVYSRLIKAELLVKQNLFNEAIKMIRSLYKNERMPHHIDEKNIVTSAPSKYVRCVFFSRSS